MKCAHALTVLLFAGAEACAATSAGGAEPAEPVASAASSPPAPVAVAVPEDGAAIRRLPRYRSEMVPASPFAGDAYVMEVGPAEAPTVVLVHGLGDNGSTDFHPVLPALAARYHVLTFDLPGFGRSSRAHELYSPETYAEFIHALVGKRVHGGMNLVGHSMGGAIALAYAARFPADVQRLFLIDTAGVLHRKAYVNFAIAAGLENVLGAMAETGKAIANDAMERSAQATEAWLPTSPPDPAVLLRSDLLRAKVLQTPTRIAALATIVQDFGPAIAKVESPTWILWGGKDAVAPVRTGRLLRARLPYAELAILDGAGHDPMSERPTAVAAFLMHGLGVPVRPPWKRVRVAPVLPERPVRCEGKKDVTLSGDYSEISLDGCTATLRGVRARQVHVRSSDVVLEDTVVFSSDVAVDAKASHVQMTACELSGAVALQVDGGELDLAGVDFHGDDASVRVTRAARFVFSVSHVESAVQRRFVHEAVDAASGEVW